MSKLTLPDGSQGQLTPLFSEAQIQSRIQAIAAEINQTYQGVDQLIIIGILKGAFLFLADLIRHLDIPCQIEFVRLSSYGNQTQSSGQVQSVDLSLPNLSNEHVLLVEDIIDTGLTLHFLRDYLQSLHQTRSLRIASLLDKPGARLHPIAIDFRGFTIENQFVVGYGLDLAGFYRNLPYIGVIQPIEK